jgi:probable F420-dependent oxidoreductase
MMRFGIPLIGDVERLGDLALEAEQVGADSAWVPEHLAWPVEIASDYPYTEDGAPPVVAGFPTFDPWVLLASVAARTTKILLGTSVYILPLRDPHVTARAVGTLDAVSGGRAILGVGVGWMREEFEVVAQDFATRGARTDEIIDILRGLWSEGPYGHAGQHYRFAPVHFEPKPPQRERLPIVVGGESPRALRRAACVADGWIGLRHTPESAAERTRELRRIREAVGRLAEPFTVTVGVPGRVGPADVERYAQAGVDRVCLRPWGPNEPPEAGLERLGRLIDACA